MTNDIQVRERQNEYKRQWSNNNRDKVRQSQTAYWEKLARARFGSDYRPPEDGERLSSHARTVYNEYFANRRKTHPEENRAAVSRYWKRKVANEAS